MAVESPAAAQRATAPEGDPARYVDDEVGTVDSIARRLALAEDEDVALRHRVTVLAEVGRFVDEFFQLTGAHRDGVRQRVLDLLVRHGETLRGLRPRLAEVGVELFPWDELDAGVRTAATAAFRDRVAPKLAPVTVEPGRTLPPPANLTLNLAAVLRGADGRRTFGLVELPPVMPRFVRMPLGRGVTGVTLLPVEAVTAANLGLLFPAHEIEGWAAYRVTRRAGILVPPGVDDILASVERQLRLERHGRAVRLEVDPGFPEELLGRLMADLEVGGDQVYAVGGLMATADLASLPLDPGKAAPAPRPGLRPGPDMFRRLDGGDVLVHFPYDSYADSVVALLDQASADPALLAIKQTLYRPWPDGPTVRALVRAAERGAHVVAVVELAARLDERNSLASARALERAGAHVVYGLVGLRTHCPLTLVIRDGGARVCRYGVLGTGLHHPTRRPEGISVLTADPDVTTDLTHLFNYLTGYSRPARYRKLLVGPGHLRSRLLDLIRRETAAGPAGRIVLKVYRLVDREVVDALYRASQRGVRTDLVVSGACALRPGLSGLSERIRVVAGGGRHFETSRVFLFGEGATTSVLISSGDVALTQLDRQVDVAAPVDDPAHRARLRSTLDVMLRFPAWEMDGDGCWRRQGSGAEAFLRALAASAGTPGVGGASLVR